MQRVFDINNEKDVRDLFDILPDGAMKLKKLINNDGIEVVYENCYETTCLLKIKWEDVEEITRPIQEATEADIGKLCVFWDLESEAFGKKSFFCMILDKIDEEVGDYKYIGSSFDIGFMHCRRLTKQEIENLC